MDTINNMVVLLFLIPFIGCVISFFIIFFAKKQAKQRALDGGAPYISASKEPDSDIKMFRYSMEVSCFCNFIFALLQAMLLNVVPSRIEASMFPSNFVFIATYCIAVNFIGVVANGIVHAKAIKNNKLKTTQDLFVTLLTISIIEVPSAIGVLWFVTSLPK